LLPVRVWLPWYSAVNTPIRTFNGAALASCAFLVLLVCVGLSVIESPSIQIRSPFELGAIELVATLAGLVGFIRAGGELQIGYELMQLSGY
jgi:hypothetical protein